MARVLMLLCAASLCACSTMGKEGRDGFGTARQGFGEAIMSPLEDVNLRREEIPIVLRALRGPYPLTDPRSCRAIAAHVSDLSAALGPDADERAEGENGLGEKAGEGALDVISDTASDFIPFRGVVRYATGASAHEKKVRQAYQNGIARRAYLKGLGQARGCDGKAAPDRS